MSPGATDAPIAREEHSHAGLHVAVNVDGGLHLRAAAEQRLVDASSDQKKREMFGSSSWFGHI